MSDRHPGMTRWHYTIGHKLRSILSDGLIKPATAAVPKGQKPAVWFSVNPVWEETAAKGFLRATGEVVRADKQTVHERGGGLARIGVAAETAPHDWQAFKRLSGIPAKEAGGLYAVAVGRCARPGEWYVIFEPVPRERWLAIEVWDGSAWIPHAD